MWSSGARHNETRQVSKTSEQINSDEMTEDHKQHKVSLVKLFRALAKDLVQFSNMVMLGYVYISLRMSMFFL